MNALLLFPCISYTLQQHPWLFPPQTHQTPSVSILSVKDIVLEKILNIGGTQHV